ncbi:hypothetical protein YC2023_012024 [Brassica napus]
MDLKTSTSNICNQKSEKLFFATSNQLALQGPSPCPRPSCVPPMLTEPSFKNTVMPTHYLQQQPEKSKLQQSSSRLFIRLEYDFKYQLDLDPRNRAAESRKTQLFDTESSADDGAEHENYGDKIQNAPVGSPQRQEAQKNLLEEINHRKQIDQNIIEILRLSLKKTDVLDLLTSTRTTGQPVVDDWDCYKTLVKSFKNQCGAKMEYDMKYAGALANICNMGVDVKKSVAAIEEALSDRIRLGGTRVNISYSRVMLYGLQFYNLEPEQLIKSSYILVNGTNRQSQNIGYDFCCRPKNPKDKP